MSLCPSSYARLSLVFGERVLHVAYDHLLCLTKSFLFEMLMQNLCTAAAFWPVRDFLKTEQEKEKVDSLFSFYFVLIIYISFLLLAFPYLFLIFGIEILRNPVGYCTSCIVFTSPIDLW